MRFPHRVHRQHAYSSFVMEGLDESFYGVRGVMKIEIPVMRVPGAKGSVTA